MKYQVFVEGKSNSIRIKSNEYKLQDYTIEISDNKRWFWFLELEGSDSFGLSDAAMSPLNSCIAL